MKFIKFILFFSLILLSLCTYSQGYEIYKGDTVNRKDENGFKQGKWVIDNSLKRLPDYKTDQVVEVGNYKNNRKEGVWITYFPNGKKKNELTYKRNIPDGHAKFYYETGIVSEEGTWIGNKWHGSYKYFYANGKPMYEFNYIEGKREGKQRYFHENGKVKIEGSWASGKEEGTIKVFDENGGLISEKVFENGEINKDLSKSYDKPVQNNKPTETITAPIVKREAPPADSKEVIVEETEDKQLKVIFRQTDGTEKIGMFDGEGHHVLKNKSGQVQSEGFYNKGRLINGKEYKYIGFELHKTLIYKNGSLIKTIENKPE